MTPIGRWLRGFTAPNPNTLDPGNVNKNELYDAQTAAVMERVLERGSNCVDVGCHAGQILDEMLRVAPEGTHYAFEPLPHLYAELEKKYAGRPNVKLSPCGLAEAAGESTFQHVVTNPAYSGIRRRAYDRPNEEVVEIHVKLARLDDVVPRGLPIRFVKIDVEGAELGVLKGGLELLRRCRPYVVFEHGLGGSDHYGTRPEHIFELMRGCRLKVSLMGGWLEGRRPLRLPELVEQFERGHNYYFLAHP